MSSPTENADRRGGAVAPPVPAGARLRAASAAAAAVLTAAGVTTLTLAPSARAAGGCQVAYTLSSSWPGGFTAGISITNLGSPLTSWTLAFTLPGNEAVGQGWSATYSQSGQKVTATNVSYNGGLATNGSTSIGFNGSYTGGSYPGNPTSFTLNGTTCTGSVTTSPPPTTSPPTTSPSTTPSTSGHLYQLESNGTMAPRGIVGTTP